MYVGFQPSQIGRKPAISQASTVRVNGRTAVSAPSSPGASLSLSSALRWMRRYLAERVVPQSGTNGTWRSNTPISDDIGLGLFIGFTTFDVCLLFVHAYKKIDK